MDWWGEFWTWVNENTFVATVLGTVAAAAIIALASRLPRIGPHVRVVLGWLWASRPVSARRAQRAETELQERVDRLEQSTLSQDEIASVARKAAEEALADSRALDAARAEWSELVAATGAKITAQLETQAADTSSPGWLPAPDPRWKLLDITSKKDRDAGVERYRIKNLVPDSIARHVRMDNAKEYDGSFSFDDAAFWPDLSGEASGEFRGSVEGTAEDGFARIRLTWINEFGKGESKIWRLKGQSVDFKGDTGGYPDVPF